MPMEKINEPVDMKITLSIFAAAILPLTSEAPLLSRTISLTIVYFYACKQEISNNNVN